MMIKADKYKIENKQRPCVYLFLAASSDNALLIAAFSSSTFPFLVVAVFMDHESMMSEINKNT